MPRLANQPWILAARKVIDALDAVRPGCARFVGGCVRNALLDEPVADVDIATQLTPDLVEKACRNAGMAVHPTGIEHGTLTVVAAGVPYEVTTLRRDVETDGRRATVSFTHDWAADAQRRDFRMNALYADSDGEIFDPVGGGLDDIAQRRIVFVGDAETRIREDYLRILRFFRFQAWYGVAAPDPVGLAACGQLRGGLDGISAERIWMETKKLLGAPRPLAALEAMQRVGVLDQLFPGSKGLGLISKLVGLEMQRGFAPDPMLRFLALFWKDADKVHAIANKLKMSNDERHRLNWPTQDETPLWGGITDAEVRAAVYRAGQQVVTDRAMMEWAKGGVDDWAGVISVANAWQRPAMPVSGADLLAKGVSEGPDLGATLRRLESDWVDSDFTLGREDLLARV
jgi:poly(A) polymerase